MHTDAVQRALAALESLPTVAAGKQALGLRGPLQLPPAPELRHLSHAPHNRPAPYLTLPGVPARAFHDEARPAWAAQLAAAYPEAKAELAALLARPDSAFRPYQTDFGMTLPSVNTFDLFVDGERVEESCARCPATARLLEGLPRLLRDHVALVVVNPWSRIPPSVGLVSGALQAHLPLVVSEPSRLHVGTEQRAYREGELVIFDEAYIHELRNPGAAAHVSLMLAFAHPCLGDEEVAAYQELRRALRQVARGGTPRASATAANVVLAERAGGGELFPSIIDLELSNRCNLACEMCLRPVSQGFMSQELLDKVLDEALEVPGRVFRLHGLGEPLLAPTFQHAVRRIKSHAGGHRIHLVTNGHLLDAATRSFILRQGVDKVTVSIGAVSAETYERVRHSKSFPQLLRQTVTLVNERDRLCAPTVLEVQLVRVPPADAEVEAFVEFWSKADVTVAIWEDLFRGPERRPPLVGPCEELWTYTLVLWDGSVHMCCADPFRVYQVGDVSQQTLRAVYNGAALNKLRAIHLRGEEAELMPACRHCTYRDGAHVVFSSNVCRSGARPPALQPVSRLPIIQPR